MNYDGETIFRGLFLGQGAVADLFPEVWKSEAMKPYLASLRDPNAAAGIDQMMMMIRQKDPLFFDNFRAAMQSGDPVQIQQAMKDSGKMCVSLAEDMKAKGDIGGKSRAVDNPDGAQSRLGSPRGTCVLVWVLVDLAVAIHVVAVAQVAAVLWLAEVYAIAGENKDPIALVGGTDSTLAKDVFVASVAQRLAK
jgi:SdpC family antimicrobial peptide